MHLHKEARHGGLHGCGLCPAAFWGAELGDERRTRRLIQVATAFAQGGGGEAGGTITSVIRDWHQAKAAYRLLDRPQVNHQAVLAGHFALTLEATAAPGEYLLIEDSSVLAYPGLKQTRGLGPIGEDYTRGLWMHSTLVVKMDWEKDQQELLGLLGQRVWARPLPGAGSGQGSKQGRRRRWAGASAGAPGGRESERWMAALEAAGGPLGDTRWTYVADRESDIYECFQSAFVNGWSYVIRAAHPRALAGRWAGSDLFAAAGAAPLRGTFQLELPRQGRTARLQVRSTSLELRGPLRPGGRLENHTTNVVEVREIDPPNGQEPLHWVLLTDYPVDTLEQCLRVVRAYRCRWLVEEWHKAMKSGLKVEASQLSDARRLSALIAILSVVAVFLVQHKLAARTDPQAPLPSGEVDPTMLTVLRKIDPPRGRPTRGWFWIAIAKLGGFPARKGDGHPGWLTLWRGWQTLMILMRGHELARGP
jgi:hypothetical protein